MHLLDLTLPTLNENLALDEALLLEAEAGGPEALRFWEWPQLAVVLGAAAKLTDDVHEDACQADVVPIARRSSGGGTVLLGSGCLIFSLVLRFDRHPALSDLHASYRFILSRVQEALSPQVASVSHQGLSDVTMANRKFSGNSQQRKRTHLLHHGTILHHFDLAAVARYLKPPVRQPDYRRDRAHEDFITNVALDGAQLRVVLAKNWNATTVLMTWPQDAVRQLVAEKYGRADWVRHR
jgi:lipoate-protein ligase A